MALEKYYVVTVQIAVLAQDQGECSDAVSALLEDAQDNKDILDWSYLRLGGQYLSAGQEAYVDPETYVEGELFP